jgi:hypothetical protein
MTNVDSPQPVSKPAARRRWQWSLRTLLLLTAAIAAWTAYYQVRRQSEIVRREIASMENVTRRLTVNDQQQFAAIKQQPMWHNDDRWQVYLPPGNAYRMKLVTREVDIDDFPEAPWQSSIEAGRHEIAYAYEYDTKAESGRLKVLVDGQVVIEATEGPPWNPSIGFSSHNDSFERVVQKPLSQPLVLTRRRFMIPDPAGGGSSSSFKGPVSGVLLWIESDDGAGSRQQ